jgi:hypothetical protein
MQTLIENLKTIIVRWWTCDVRYRSEFQRKPRKEITMETNSYYCVEDRYAYQYIGPSFIKALKACLKYNVKNKRNDLAVIYKDHADNIF